MAASPSALSVSSRRGAVAQCIALIGAAVALAAVIALIVTWPDHGDGGSSDATPPTAKHGVRAAVGPSPATDPRR